jgi:hypothetical protein
LTNTYRKSDIFKDYDVDKNVNTAIEDAIDCPRCKLATIAKLDLASNQITEHNTQILHKHSADRLTKTRILAWVATNKRLLGERDSADFHYAPRRDRN